MNLTFCRLAEQVLAPLGRAAITALPRPTAPKVAVLMYHNVCRLPAFEAGVYQHVLPHQFADQMALLRRRNYRVAPLEELVEKTAAGERLPPRTVAITFDDGYRALLEAWPQIERRGFTATIFLATGYIGKDRSFSWLEGGLGSGHEAVAPLSWDEVSELARRGADFGSHSVHHLPLDGLDEPQLLAELAASKEDIEDHLGRRVRIFSIPFACPETAGFRRRFVPLLRRAGYVAAVTTAMGRVGRGADITLLPRLQVNAQDSLEIFEAKLEGAYDWLRPVQRGYKLWLKRAPERPRPRPGPRSMVGQKTPQPGGKS
ncbi:MAG: polysaccharide deacetylase family protein [Pseudomonadota bacterium]